MPAPGPGTDDVADILDIDYSEFERWINERNQADLDKSNIGIPADESDYFLGSHNDHDPSNGLASASQVSCGQSSWERISGTSHGTSASFQEPVYGGYSQPQWDSLLVAVNPPRITINDSTTRPIIARNVPCTAPHAGSALGDSWIPSYATYYQTPAESSEPMDSSPNTLSPDPDMEHPDPRWMEDMRFADRIDLEEAQDNSLTLAGPDVAPNLPSVETPGQARYPYRDLGQLNLAEDHGRRPYAATEPSSTKETSNALNVVCLNASDVGLHRPKTGEGEGLAARPQKAKRKRDNVDKINSVRKFGACIRCAVLHEQVGHRNLL